MLVLPDMKTCTRCGQVKDASEFYRTKKTRDGLYPQCKPCAAATKKASRERDAGRRVRAKEYTAAYKQRHPERVRRSNRKQGLRKFGLTVERYDEMFNGQSGCCSSCGDTQSRRAVAVDHDHVSNKVRALLCDKCNTALGLLGDDPARIEALLNYRKRY